VGTVTMHGERHNSSGFIRPARAAATWFRNIRRQRFARTITRNARWVSEARQTPTVWTEYESDSPDTDAPLVPVA
jgi:hypothetical protein